MKNKNLEGYKNNFARSKIALFVTSAILSNGAVAQNASATEKSVAKSDIEIIQVTGIKSTIEGALLEKRASDVITDGISADDLGNFPDLNLGEALQRIPGVQIDRESARREASISVRGLPGSFALTTVQGLGIASAADNGSSANPFGMFDSAIFNGAYVTKSFRSDILSGGLSANVDLRITSGLKRKDGQVVVRTGGAYEELTEDFLPEFYISGSKHLMDGKLGVYGTVSWEDMSFRRDVISINGYRAIGENAPNGWGEHALIDRTGLEPNAEVIVPEQYRQSSENSQGDRLSISTGFEYQINDEMSFRTDVIYANRNLDKADTQIMLADLKNSPNTFMQQGDLTSIGMANFVLEPEGDEAILAPTYVMSNFTYEDITFRSDNRSRPKENKVYAIYPQFNYESDNLTGRVVGAFSKSNNISGQNTYSTALRQQGNDSDVDDSNGVRGFINTGLGNWNDFSYGITLPEGGFGLVGDGKFNSSGTNVTLQTAAQRLRCDDINNQCPRDENGHIIYNEERGPGRVLLGVGGTSTAAERTYNSIGTDWEYNVYDMGPITSFKAGATYIREEAISAKAENSALGIPLTGYAELAEQLFVPNSSEEGNGFFGREIDVEVANNVTLDTDVLLDFILPLDSTANTNNEPLITDNPLFASQLPFVQRGPNAIARTRKDNFSSEKDAVEAYLMVNFSGDNYDIPLRGNIGLRYVDADISGRLKDPAVGDGVDSKGSYDAVLPSVNLIYDLTEDIVLRAAYYETFESVELTEFNPAPTVVVNNAPSNDDEDNGGDDGFPSVGNVRVDVSSIDVQPRTSTAYDLGIAWYNRKGSMVGFNLFTKDVKADVIKQRICPLDGVNLVGEITSEEGDVSIGTFNSGQLLLDDETCRINDGFTDNEISRNRRIVIEQNINQDSITKVKGFEFQATQSLDFLDKDNFFKDFGFTLNYSRVKNENEEGRSLNRVSPESYNLIGYYETKKFGVRLAYNFRNGYGVESTSTAVVGDRTVGSRGQLDAQINYNLPDDYKVKLQLFNLTDQDPYEYDTTTLLPRRLQYDGRTIKLSVQKRF